MARRCASIPHGPKVWRLSHSQISRNLTHDHDLRRLIPPEGQSIQVLWVRENPAWWCRLCKMLSQLGTPRKWMWITRCAANRQVATVSPMSLSLRRAHVAWEARSKPVLGFQRRQWLWRSGYGRVLVLIVSFVLIYLSQWLNITWVARLFYHSGFL